MKRFLTQISGLMGACLLAFPVWAAKPIQHDAEHYVLLHQYQDQWAAEDKAIDKKRLGTSADCCI